MGIVLNPFTGNLDFTGSGGGGGSGTAARYVQAFNNTTDWGTLSGGYYTITVTAATHGKGTRPNVTTMEQNGSNYETVFVDLISINGSGDVSIRVLGTPDTRFTGLIIIL